MRVVKSVSETMAALSEENNEGHHRNSESKWKVGYQNRDNENGVDGQVRANQRVAW